MWDPFEEMEKMKKEMDRMFRNFFSKSERRLIGSDRFLTHFQQPLTDIKETKKDVFVTIDLPGVEKKDIILNIKNNLLEIKAQKKQEIKIDKKGFHQHERSYSGFYRSIPLPANVKSENIETEYRNGVLRIKIPKTKEKHIISKKIKIK
jgi:HSP20 family protein